MRGVVAQPRACIIEGRFADKTRLGERLLPLQIGRRQIASRLSLAQLLSHSLDFDGSLAGLQVGESRLGGLQLLFRLTARCQLILALEHEQRSTLGNLRASLHRKLLKGSSERRCDANVFAFDIPLQRPVAALTTRRHEHGER